MPRKGESGRRPRAALGRGLSALLPPGQPPADGVVECAIDDVHPRPDQPRRHFDKTALEELAASIREQGVMVPIVVRRTERPGHEIIFGERRWRASQLAGLETVPVVIRDASDAQAFEMALVENLQREDLNPVEEAEAYQRLLDDYGLTQADVAVKVGKERSTVANALRLLKLPETVRNALIEGKLSQGHARALLGLPAAQVEKVGRRVIKDGLSVRATESLVRKLRGNGRSGRSAQKPPPAARDLEAQLRRALGTKVSLRQRGNGSGRIEIAYHSLSELDRLLDLLLK